MRFKNKNFLIIFSILIFWIIFGGMEAKADRQQSAPKDEQYISSGKSIMSVGQAIQEYVAWIPDTNWFEGDATAGVCETSRIRSKTLYIVSNALK